MQTKASCLHLLLPSPLGTPVLKPDLKEQELLAVLATRKKYFVRLSTLVGGVGDGGGVGGGGGGYQIGGSGLR